LGIAYTAKGEYDAAVEDFDHAIKLYPTNAPKNYPPIAPVYNNRAYAYAHKGDYGRAIADFTRSIELDPRSFGPYLTRAVVYLYAGKLSEALADLNTLDAKNPNKSPYTALWLDIVSKRANQPSRMREQATTQIDMSKWPAPLVRLHLGELTTAEVLSAADDPSPGIKQRHMCEANFYSGERALQQGGKDEAARLFRLAAAGCVRKNFLEYVGANAELRQLATPR